MPNYFDVEQFDVNVEQRNNALGQRVTVVGGGQGESRRGPVVGGGRHRPGQRADVALRKDLGKYQADRGAELTDYRVYPQWRHRGATRVLIESADETGERWTVGVSPNIIDACSRR